MPAPDANKHHTPTGHDLQDADLLLRAQVAQRMGARLSRRVEYEGNYRAGVFTYIDGPLRVRFGQEMGGGGCLAVLEVPRAHTWEALTGIPLAQRDEIVRFVAEQVTHTFGSRFEIGATSITIY